MVSLVEVLGALFLALLVVASFLLVVLLIVLIIGELIGWKNSA